ncbi:MAG TPA: hypothetical protein VK400_20125 [Pyrinomonadaceae bacterium]|nr:hypothetical protein [Pyrinomonadaceae bacterium]
MSFRFRKFSHKLRFRSSGGFYFTRLARIISPELRRGFYRIAYPGCGENERAGQQNDGDAEASDKLPAD